MLEPSTSSPLGTVREGASWYVGLIYYLAGRLDESTSLLDLLERAASYPDLANAALRHRWIREHWTEAEVTQATRRVLGEQRDRAANVLLEVITEHGGQSEVVQYRAWADSSTPEASAHSAGTAEDVAAGSLAGSQTEGSTSADAPPSIQEQSSNVLYVAARRLDAFSGLLPAWHLSLVLLTDDGTQVEYEGGPERPGPVRFGRIVARRRPYRPRPDREALKVQLASGRLTGYADRLDHELDRVNSLATGYHPLGPNSNSVARNLLLAVGLQALQPTAIAPGFDLEIGEGSAE